MEKFDLALAYEWEYDHEFLQLVEHTLQQRGLTTYIIGQHNVAEVTALTARRKLHFLTLLDRAWDIHVEFEKLGRLLARRGTRIFNPYKQVRHAIDKATMHLEFITAGLDVPYSIIIPPHSESEDIYLSVKDLAILGRPFIIKPCNTTGGGIGVVTGAESLEEVLQERLNNTDDKYLLQEKIHPAYFGGRRAWFRCFYAFGEAIPVWWDDQTHIYTEITAEEEAAYGLRKLRTIMRKIGVVTGLDFFSAEIAITPEKKFVVIDYVNDQCDMRFKSGAFNGVPNGIAEAIAGALCKAVQRQKKKPQERRP